jgi:hypothetical protein
MFVIARAPRHHEFWIRNMVLIQAIDLAAGLVYTLTGVVSLRLSAFPMFNAAVIALLLWFWRPAPEATVAAPANA